jgi:hypothetical protein
MKNSHVSFDKDHALHQLKHYLLSRLLLLGILNTMAFIREDLFLLHRRITNTTEGFNCCAFDHNWFDDDSHLFRIYIGLS